MLKNLKIRTGDVYDNEPINDASMPPQHVSHGGGFRSIR